MMRRWAIRIGLFLLLGAVTTVAVAWGSAIWITPQGILWGDSNCSLRDGGRWGVADSYPYSAWAISEYSTRSAMQLESAWFDPDVSLGGLFGYWPVDSPPEPLVPDWAPFLTPPQTPTKGQGHERILDIRGWPMLSMWSLASYDGATMNNRTYIITRGIPLPSTVTVVGILIQPGAIALPLGIRWLEFAVNSVFYGAVWMVLVGLVISLCRGRAWLRLRRHQCPRCGYPIGVSPVCTECGAALEKNVIAKS